MMGLFRRQNRGRGRVGTALALSLLLGTLAASGVEVTCQVVAANPTAGTLTLRGPGLTNPGAGGNQTVAVGAGDAAIGYVGQTVRGDLHQSDATWRLDDIWPDDATTTATLDETTRRLRYEITEMGRQSYRDIGDQIPNFVLYNQDGQLVRTSSLLGHHCVIDFIFTRCAQPTMCPATTLRMAQLQKALKQAKLADVTLVTVTFDPLYDTPGVLRQYMQAYGIDSANFEFLTGPSDEITALMEEFGILTRTVDGVLQHTNAVLLVSPQGRITYRNDTNLWTAQELLEHLQRSAAATATKAAS